MMKAWIIFFGASVLNFFPGHASSMGIEEAFLSYVQSTDRTRGATFQKIQNEEFISGAYKFRYSGLAFGPAFEPFGDIKVQKIERRVEKSVLTAEWAIGSTPTALFSFPMCFSVDSILSDRLLAPFSPEQKAKFAQDWGYNESGKVDLKASAPRYCSRYVGFTKDNPGFDPTTSKPVTFNYASDNQYDYSDLNDEYYFVLDRTNWDKWREQLPGYPMDRVSGSEKFDYITKDIYHGLQTPGFFKHTYHDSSIRRPLSKQGATLHLSTGIANNIENTLYAISPDEKFYVAGELLARDHSFLLKGAPAWCAGHISIKLGKITFLSNNSGHYCPHAYQLYTFIEELESQDFFAENAQVEVYKGPNNKISSLLVKDFLAFDKFALKEAWEIAIKEKIKEYDWVQMMLNY